MRDDGAAAELDNVHSDIEDVAAGRGNDDVVGNDAANVLDGGDGDDRLTGGGGVDAYVGGAGADALFARDGLAEEQSTAEHRPTPARPTRSTSSSTARGSR